MESHALLPSIDSTACPQARFLCSIAALMWWMDPGSTKKEESLRSANPWTGHPARSRCNVRGRAKKAAVRRAALGQAQRWPAPSFLQRWIEFSVLQGGKAPRWQGSAALAAPQGPRPTGVPFVHRKFLSQDVLYL
eukprot:s4550_g5.t1